MEFENWLKALADGGGSDLYLTTGAPPSAKFDVELRPLAEQRLSPGFTRDLAYELMDAQQARGFDEKLEMNLAISLPGVGRFRVNIFKQRNEVGLVARYIVVDIPPMQQLGLPSIAADLIERKRGLLLVVGATGSGKSTTLASLIDHRNSTMGGHIVTIEDPVEFIHRHKKSIVNQRELGVDTRSWENALKNTLRQAPDVIYIGETRDRATMEYAISFAETALVADGSISELIGHHVAMPCSNSRGWSLRSNRSAPGITVGEGLHFTGRYSCPERYYGEVD